MTLVASDFDGTLTQADLTVLLGREHDVAGEIRGLAEQGLRGERGTSPRRSASGSLSSKECRKRDLIADLCRSGVSVAIISGSFEGGVKSRRGFRSLPGPTDRKDIQRSLGRRYPHDVLDAVVLERTDRNGRKIECFGL